MSESMFPTLSYDLCTPTKGTGKRRVPFPSSEFCEDLVMGFLVFFFSSFFGLEGLGGVGVSWSGMDSTEPDVSVVGTTTQSVLYLHSPSASGVTPTS